jgi:hypothetical protein
MGPARSDELGDAVEAVLDNANVPGGAGSRRGAEGPYRTGGMSARPARLLGSRGRPRLPHPPAKAARTSERVGSPRKLGGGSAAKKKRSGAP